MSHTIEDANSAALWIIGGMIEEDGQPVDYSLTRAMAIRHLEPKHFLDNDARRYFEIVSQMMAEQEPINCVTFTMRLRDDEEWRKQTSLPLGLACARIHEAGSCSPLFFENAYNRIMAGFKAVMKSKLADALKSGEANQSEIYERTQELEAEGIKKPPTLGSYLLQFLKKADKRRRGELKLWGTGLNNLDKHIGGLAGGELVIIGARPNVGKSSHACTMQINAITHNGPRSCLFTKEMSPDEMTGRLACNSAGIAYSRVIKGEASAAELSRLVESTSCIRESDHMVDILPNDIEQLLAAIELRAKDGFKLFIIDYIQQVGDKSAGKNALRYQEIERVCDALKMIAVRLDVAIVAYAQLKRDADHGRRPGMSDLRESGGIENYADIVLLLHRTEVNNEPEGDSEEARKFRPAEIDDTAEIIIAKFRRGPRGLVKASFVGGPMRWEDR